jgi:phosphoserine phosphatase
MEVVNGSLTGRPVGRLCYGKEKKTRLIEYCEKNNNTFEESWYYADSISDYPVLSIVDHPVCINPDKKLKKKAMANKWKIYKWK